MTVTSAVRFVVKPLVFVAGARAGAAARALAALDLYGAASAPTRSTRSPTSPGIWTLRFVLLTLAVTPLRRLTGWNVLVRFRRMLGLFAFFYGTLHFSTWLVLDQFFAWEFILADIAKRPYITVGFIGFVLMIPLALTSTAGWIRRLGGKRWNWLHRLVYVTGVAGVVHYWWLVKVVTDAADRLRGDSRRPCSACACGSRSSASSTVAPAARRVRDAQRSWCAGSLRPDFEPLDDLVADGFGHPLIARRVGMQAVEAEQRRVARAEGRGHVDARDTVVNSFFSDSMAAFSAAIRAGSALYMPLISCAFTGGSVQMITCLPALRAVTIMLRSAPMIVPIEISPFRSLTPWRMTTRSWALADRRRQAILHRSSARSARNRCRRALAGHAGGLHLNRLRRIARLQQRPQPPRIAEVRIGRRRARHLHRRPRCTSST